MKHIHYIFAVLIVLGVMGLTWYGYAPNTSDTASSTTPLVETEESSTSTATKKPSTGQALPLLKTDLVYKNFNYGFSINYPKTTKPETDFRAFYLLSNQWRAKATPEYRGTPVLSFVVFREDNNTKYPKQYPLYFSAEVRIGVSTDIKNCYVKDAGYTNQKVTDVTINGTTWKRFSFADAAMMQYVQGESYRTVRNNTCFVLEQIKTGSNYRDEAMTVSTPLVTLDAKYANAESILRTFRFTK